MYVILCDNTFLDKKIKRNIIIVSNYIIVYDQTQRNIEKLVYCNGTRLRYSIVSSILKNFKHVICIRLIKFYPKNVMGQI